MNRESPTTVGLVEYHRVSLPKVFALFSSFSLFILDREIGDYDSTIDPRDVKVVKTLAS